MRHIPKSKKEQGDIPKKVGDYMPLEYFQRYLQNIVFGLNKVLCLDGTIDAFGGLYIIALNIQDPHKRIGYKFVTYIENHICNEIVFAQQGEREHFYVDVPSVGILKLVRMQLNRLMHSLGIINFQLLLQEYTILLIFLGIL